MLDFDNEQVRYEQATAAWFLYRHAVTTFARRSPILKGKIELAKKTVNWKDTIALASFNEQTRVSTLSMSPFTLVYYAIDTCPSDVGFGRWLYNLTLHIAAHEISHVIINQTHMDAHGRLTIQSHGKEWKKVMKDVFQIKKCGATMTKHYTQIPNKLESEAYFWSTIEAKFTAWRNGSIEC